MAIIKQVEIAGAGVYPSTRLNQRERKGIQVSNAFVPATPGDWASVPSTLDTALDTLASTLTDATVQVTVTTAWDFSVNGGAVSSIPLSVTLPDNAIVLEVIADVITQIVGAGTIQLTVPTDTLSLGTLSSADTVLPKDVSPATPKKITANRVLQATIAGAVVTAGRIRFHIRYILGE